VVSKGLDTPEGYARLVLGELYDRMPVMVLNDEGHHCWRRLVNSEAPEPKLTGEEGRDLKEQLEEATGWIEGLDKLNNANPRDAKRPGLAVCADLSATPFYISGSGHPDPSRSVDVQLSPGCRACLRCNRVANHCGVCASYQCVHSVIHERIRHKPF